MTKRLNPEKLLKNLDKEIESWEEAFWLAGKEGRKIKRNVIIAFKNIKQCVEDAIEDEKGG